MLCLTDSAAVLYWWAGCLCCTGKVAFVMIGDFRELISLLQSILILGYCCFHIQFYFGLKVNRSCVKLCPLSHLLFHKHNTHSSTALIKLYVHCTTWLHEWKDCKNAVFVQCCVARFAGNKRPGPWKQVTEIALNTHENVLTIPILLTTCSSEGPSHESLVKSTIVQPSPLQDSYTKTSQNRLLSPPNSPDMATADCPS